METCQTCNHWKPKKYSVVFGPDNPVPSNCGICSRGHGQHGEATDPIASAWARDASDYEAFIWTKAEHGCKMHELAKAEAVK